MKKILITGAGGMLGAAVCRHLSHLASYEVFAAARNNNSHITAKKTLVGDLNDSEYISELGNLDVDAVIHCAALTNIEKSEKEPETAFSINAKATENLALQFPQATFIYISTDSVFDGQTENYTEKDEPNPLNVYAQTKLSGEEAVAKANKNHYILRTNMYGFHRPPSGRSLFEWSYQNLSQGSEVGGFSNVIFNPLYVGQIAEVIEQLIVQKPPFGIYNATCDEPLSKFEFLQKVALKFDFAEDLIIPTEIIERPVNALRPLKTSLKNDKLVNKISSLNLTFERGLGMLYDDFSEFIK